VKPKFLIDEDVYTCLKFILAERGYDADAVELRRDLDSKSDEQIMEAAVREERVVITFNVGDYEGLHDAYVEEGRSHPGVIVCRQQEGYRNFGRLLRWMGALLKTVREVGYANQLLRLHTF
jgi:hypothetical protein